MKNEIKVSIIIPCYNAEDYIDKCLKSILRDRIKEKEIIIVNDGSKDNSLELLKRYERKYECIKIIDQKNSGQAVARNVALTKAKGEYICFVDIDDYVEKDMFYKLYNFAKKNNYDYVYCDFYEHYSYNDVVISNHHNDNIEKDKVLANFAPWGKLISHKLIKKLDFKFLEGRIFEDIATIPFLGANSESPGYFNEPLYYYNMTNQSTMRQKNYNPKYEDMLYVSDYIYDTFKKNNLLEKFEEELKYIYMDSILKSGVINFSKYKESLKFIPLLRKNVKNKFKSMLNNKYFKAETLYRKFTVISSIYFPPKLLFFMKKVKK